MVYELRKHLTKGELKNERNELVAYYKSSIIRKKSFIIYDEKGNESFNVSEKQEKPQKSSWNNSAVTKYVVFQNGEQIADGRFDFAIRKNVVNHSFFLDYPQVTSVSVFGKMGDYFVQLEKHHKVSIYKDNKLFCEIAKGKGVFSNQKITSNSEVEGTLLLCLFCIAKLMIEQEDLIKE